MDDTRFYSFVAGLYLSPLQCGLQTGHAISEVYTQYRQKWGEDSLSEEMQLFDKWAEFDKTIIILNARNSRGVRDVFLELTRFASVYSLPFALFNEDGDSLNGAATACGIVVPKQFYDVKFVKGDAAQYSPDFYELATGDRFSRGSTEFEFIEFLKSYRSA